MSGARVVLTLDEQKQPGMLEKRLVEAQMAGVQLEIEHSPSHAEKRWRAFNAGETTTGTLAHDDERGFLDKLGEIAAGRLRVV